MIQKIAAAIDLPRSLKKTLLQKIAAAIVMILLQLNYFRNTTEDVI